jgi:hypothetical protein
MASVSSALQGAYYRVLRQRFEVVYGQGYFFFDEAKDADAVG